MDIPLKSMIISFALVTVLTPLLIQFLRAINFSQPQRKELPPDQRKKQGIPLMTGLVFIAGVGSACFFSPQPLTYLLAGIFILFGLIGFMDDFKKAYRKDPQGISGKTKLFFQFIFSGILLYQLVNSFYVDSDIHIYDTISFFLPLSVYLIFILLFIVGSTNAINFTDGFDGLLSVVAIPTYTFFFAISDKVEVKVFCLSMVGVLLGFLIYNAFPARGFMGDTGSMAIGASLSFLAVIEGVEILIPLLFIIYLAEQFSVIFQVAYFKRTGRRLFRMSPIHYHFVLKYGWKENQLVIIFGFVSWIAAIICYFYWYFFIK